MRDERGFTLLEALIAFAIAALALGVLLEVAVGGLRASQTAARFDDAVVRARSHLAMATDGGSLMPGDWQGDDGGGYRWHLHVATVAQSAAHADDADAAVPLALYVVTVWISWSDGDRTREVRLDTDQIGQPVGG
jgi:general secretion pathway protein I